MPAIHKHIVKRPQHGRTAHPGPQLHDIAVLGATPAGYAAAYYLARKKKDVILIDSPHPGTECPLTDWAPSGFFHMAGLPKNLAKDSDAREFHNVHYHNADLDKDVEYISRSRSGYFIEHHLLDKAMRQAVLEAGVQIRTSSTPPAIQLQEEQVTLLGTRHTMAKLLLIAQSRPNDVMGDLALPVRTVPQSQLIIAGLDVPFSSKDTSKVDDCLHIVEMKERSELGMFYKSHSLVHVRVISNSAASGNRAAELSSLFAKLQASGLLPTNLSLGRARGAVWHPPAGVALELETHVAKRCLLTGTAGGFVESITGQTLSPSVSSSLLAAEIALRALSSEDSQETLMQFKNVWRKELADSLRPPNTSLRLLLPLLFVNHNIVGKFTNALLFGETM